MFFSPDLLERRDSGYGLLWLAATLGAKSSLKKLPKRSVLTADISRLCGLIVEPPEPLALRLSSNLMIGVARVYKVKEEIFFSDVTTCFNALKKAVQDLSMFSANAAQLQMGQPSLRVETLTLVADPTAALGLDFDNIFLAWKEGLDDDMEDGSDDEFDPRFKKPKSKAKEKQKNVPSSVIAEHGRALHTLEEDHNHLLAAAFDASLSGSVHSGTQNAAGFGPSSSQADSGFGFDDVFAFPEGVGEGDIGDELARELGEGWGDSSFRAPEGEQTQANQVPENGTQGWDIGQEHAEDFRFDVQQGVEIPLIEGDPNDLRASLPPMDSVALPLSPFSPVHSEVIMAGLDEAQLMKPVQRKAKRVRLLLDARTELTDEELKMARANYVHEQEALKRQISQKKAERENGKLIEEMIYGAPRGFEAPVLVDFWLEHFRLHVEARSGELCVEMQGEPPRKRRRVLQDPADPTFKGGQGFSSPARVDDINMDVDLRTDWDMVDVRDDFNLDSRMRSSEEPGQARRGSRPPSAMGSHLDFDLRPAQDIISGSQRSSLFPWDHAGPSSSIGGTLLGGNGSDVFSAMRPGSKRESLIGSRRESFLFSGGGTGPVSPTDFGIRNSHLDGDDFQFNVPGEEVQEESQESNALTLEKNSFNFLEYARMQTKANSSVDSMLTFDDIVPPSTSTRRVASAAFYHCLVLSTKSLLSVTQDEPYGVLEIRVK